MEKENKDTKTKTPLSQSAVEGLVSLADLWANKWKASARIAENLAKDKRFGEAEAFNSKAKIYLECAEQLRKGLQG